VSNEEKFRTTMPQGPTELTIDNTQLSSNRDKWDEHEVYMDHVNSSMLWCVHIPKKPSKKTPRKRYVKWQVCSGLTSVGIETAKETTAATIRMMRVVS
jgi:hypothetical protein